MHRSDKKTSHYKYAFFQWYISQFFKHMTFSDLDGQTQPKSDIETLYLVKQLAHMLV